VSTEQSEDGPGRVEPLRVALLGCGVVGTAVVRRLLSHADDYASRVGRPLQIVGIAVRTEGVDRSDVGVDVDVFTTDAASLVARADIVIELMGGIEPARTLILSALEHGAAVVTANKALMAEDGPTLHEAARRAGVDLFYEAAVAGAIPLVRPLVESLAGDKVHRITGIVNGTTNYVLDQMDRAGADFDEALKQAQALGYAEADPTADIESHDAAAKAAILASLAFHTRVSASQVHREGITAVTREDVREARELDCVIKPLAICERIEDASGAVAVSARVYPAMVPRTHPLASVHDAFNAVFIEAAAAGELMFYGQGAGGDPTASAVLGDVIAAARHAVTGGRSPGESTYADLPVLPLDSVQTRYHISLDVADLPGVLAGIAAVFSEHGVSLESVRQRLVSGGEGEQRANLVVVTHRAPDAALSATVEALAADPAVHRLRSVIRVEGGL
jgi:homoserine dehydrogenase